VIGPVGVMPDEQLIRRSTRKGMVANSVKSVMFGKVCQVYSIIGDFADYAGYNEHPCQ
jgi:hypothetical protein